MVAAFPDSATSLPRLQVSGASHGWASRSPWAVATATMPIVAAWVGE